MSGRSVIRAIGWVLSLGLLIVGVAFIVKGFRWSARFEGWLAATPASFEADLSRPGEYSAPLVQTCSMAHGDVLWVEWPAGAPPKPEAALDGLMAALTVRDTEGGFVRREEIDGATSAPEETPRRVMLLRMISIPEGRYTLTLTIREGAQALTDIPCLLVVRYELCGLEALPATVLKGAGVVAVIVGGLFGLPLLLTVRRRTTGVTLPR